MNGEMLFFAARVAYFVFSKVECDTVWPELEQGRM